MTNKSNTEHLNHIIVWEQEDEENIDDDDDDDDDSSDEDSDSGNKSDDDADKIKVPPASPAAKGSYDVSRSPRRGLRTNAMARISQLAPTSLSKPLAPRLRKPLVPKMDARTLKTPKLEIQAAKASPRPVRVSPAALVSTNTLTPPGSADKDSRSKALRKMKAATKKVEGPSVARRVNSAPVTRRPGSSQGAQGRRLPAAGGAGGGGPLAGKSGSSSVRLAPLKISSARCPSPRQPLPSLRPVHKEPTPSSLNETLTVQRISKDIRHLSVGRIFSVQGFIFPSDALDNLSVSSADDDVTPRDGSSSDRMRAWRNANGKAGEAALSTPCIAQMWENVHSEGHRKGSL